MWKLKLAGKVAGNSNPLNNKELKFGKYVRYAGFGVAALLFVLGVIGVFVGPMWTGFYAIVAALPIAIVELPLALGAPMAKLLNLFRDFRIRCGMYVLLALPAFFGSATILAAVASILVGLAYVFCWFRGEEGPEVKSIFAPAEEEKGAAAAKGGKEGSKKVPLSAQGAAPGVV